MLWSFVGVGLRIVEWRGLPVGHFTVDNLMFNIDVESLLYPIATFAFLVCVS